MFPYWTFGALFLLGVLDFSIERVSAASPKIKNTRDVFIQENLSRDYLNNQECRSLVCEQAHEQAKGLAKLALLDEFVSQTIFLLNDLMQNIDGELGRSAGSLLRYIHPHCEPTKEILQEVIQKQSVKKPTREAAAANLSQGVAPLVPDEASTSTGQETGQTTGQVAGSSEQDYDDQRPDGFAQPSWGRGFDEEDYDKSHGGQGQQKYGFESKRKEETLQTTHTSQSGSRTPKVVHVPSKDDKSYQVPQKNLGGGVDVSVGGVGGVDVRRQRAGSGVHHVDYEGDQGHGRDSVKKTKNNFGKDIDKGRHYESGVGIGIGVDVLNKRCRGVNKGSAFWVPGLDDWCVKNCAQGYCPTTHCIC